MAFCVKKVGFWGKKEGLVVKIIISGPKQVFLWKRGGFERKKWGFGEEKGRLGEN